MQKIRFRTEVRSPVHGTFKPGETATHLDPAWADDLVNAGYAEYVEPKKPKDAPEDGSVQP